MSQLKVLVQTSHVIQDDKGAHMSPGYMYSVKDSERIQQFISEGDLTVILETEVESAEETLKKSAPKILKNQVTDSVNLQETSNG